MMPSSACMVLDFNKHETSTGGSGSIFFPISEVVSYSSTGIAKDCAAIYTPGKPVERYAAPRIASTTSAKVYVTTKCQGKLLSHGSSGIRPYPPGGVFLHHYERGTQHCQHLWPIYPQERVTSRHFVQD